MKLVIGKLVTKMATGSPTGTIELIIGIIHLIAAHHGLEATLVERTVVRHQRQSLDERLYLFPNVWKHRGIFSIRLGDTMDHCVPIQVVVRLWLNQGIELIRDYTVTYHHYTNAAHASALVVGGLEVDGGEIFHRAKIVNLPVFHPQRLNNHGNDNKRDAQPEGPVELLQFVEDDGGESDAVNGFQVINEVYGEG